MIDMKQTPSSPATMLSDENDEPSYPSGLQLCLDGDTLRKLGYGPDTPPMVGAKFALDALVEVVSVSKQQGTTADALQACLQITAMELEAPEDEMNEQQAAMVRLDKLYG